MTLLSKVFLVNHIKSSQKEIMGIMALEEESKQMTNKASNLHLFIDKPTK